MKARKKAVVVGAGIAGLSAALEISGLFGHRRDAPRLEVVEASRSVGGTISTVRENGFVMERGPDSVFMDEETSEFCSKIGISSRLMGTSERNRKVFIMQNGRAISLPDGFFMIAPRKILPFLLSPLFSLRCKLRTFAEVFVPARPASSGDESVASFVRRRFGDEILRKAAAPLVGGIYSASAEFLGAESVLPEFVRMEREEGGILRSILRRKKESRDESESGARFGRFFSPEGGMSEIVDAAFNSLPRQCVKMDFRVSKILKRGGVWEIVSTDGFRMKADAVVVAVPCHAAASMFTETDAALSGLLRSVNHSSCVVANLAYSTAAVSGLPPGFGLIVADARPGEVFACSFLSRKFAKRAPDGFSVIRFFISGKEACGRGDDEIISLAERSAETVFQASGGSLVSIVGRHAGRMPVCGVGHTDLVRQISRSAERLGGLSFAGAGFGGVGIPECIRGGREAGAQTVAYCSGLAKAGGKG